MRAPDIKFTRAEEHALHLNALVEKHRKDHPHRIVRQDNVKQRDTRVVWIKWRVFGLRESLPPVCSAVFGDFLTNLRAVLDHAAWELALPEAKEKDPRGIGYPITDDKTKAVRTRTNLLKQYPEAVVDVMMAHQPWQRENHEDDPLWQLNWLVNKDKHALVHVLGFAHVHVADVRMEPQPEDFEQRVVTGPLKDGDVFAEATMWRPDEGFQVTAMPTLAYGESVKVGPNERLVLLNKSGPAILKKVAEVHDRLFAAAQGYMPDE